jgi:hypothetical protein
MIGQQSLFDFPGARLELVQPLSLVRSFSSEEALDLEFTEKTLHNPRRSLLPPHFLHGTLQNAPNSAPNRLFPPIYSLLPTLRFLPLFLFLVVFN